MGSPLASLPERVQEAGPWGRVLRVIAPDSANNEISLWQVFLVSMGCFLGSDSHRFDGLLSAGEVCSPIAIQSTGGLDERCAYESGPRGDCANRADYSGRHPGRCVSDSRGDVISSILAGQEVELHGS